MSLKWHKKFWQSLDGGCWNMRLGVGGWEGVRKEQHQLERETGGEENGDNCLFKNCFMGQ